MLSLLAWSVTGTYRALQSLVLLSVLLMLSADLFMVRAGFILILRWLIIFGALWSGIYMAVYKAKTFPLPFLPILVFSFIILITTLLSSYFLTISLFKLFSFTITTLAVFLCFHFSKHRLREFEQWALTVFSAVLIISIITIPVNPFAFKVNWNETGNGYFLGIFNHSQSFAVYLFFHLNWLLVLLIRKNLTVFCKIILGIAVAATIATSARTALAATVLTGLSCSFLALFKFNWIIALRKTFINIYLLFFIILISGVVVSQREAITKSVIKYVFKRGDLNNQSLSESFQRSRGFLIEKQMKNIEKNPMMGFGFGLASDPNDLEVKVIPGTSIPIQASVEKGFIFTAVLEEVGYIGLVSFLSVMLFLIGFCFINDSLVGTWLIFAAFWINIGEMIIFSPGGLGLYGWMMIGMAVVLKDRVVRNKTTDLKPAIR